MARPPFGKVTLIVDTMPSLIAVGLLVLSHLVVGHLRFLSGTPRSVWLSLAGGVSVAYVFVHLLPDLSEAQESLSDAVPAELRFVEHHVYLIALVGLVVFYGLERAAVLSRRRQRTRQGHNARVFWLHVVVFAAYNALIGYLLHHHEATTLALFTFAMALHFAGTDFGLREHFEHRFDRIGRWVFVAAVIVGWAVGVVTEVSEGMRAVFLAFLAGAVILSVMKEELPEERESRYWAFVAGAAGYSGLMMLM